MPTIAEIHSFLQFLVEAFGAISSILILVVVFLIHQLRQEQKESREAREHLLRAQERANDIQIQFVQALSRLRSSVEKALNQIQGHDNHG